VDLVVDSDDAERLARELVDVTGESLPEAVTKALAERLVREQAARVEAARLEVVFARFRQHFDTRPVSPEEWDWAGGDDMDR
jgi:antitoxin VapB